MYDFSQNGQKANEYDKEMPQLLTTDQPVHFKEETHTTNSHMTARTQLRIYHKREGGIENMS